MSAIDHEAGLSPRADTRTPLAALRAWLIEAPWLMPALVSSVLCAWNLGTPGLWADELATAGAARLSWDQLSMLVRHVDAALAPYYVLMHLWVSVAGDSEVALRLPSCVAMVVAVVFTALIAARWGGPRAGVFAGLLLAFTPAVSRFGQEARPYALATCLAVVSTWLLLRITTRPTLGRWAAYAATLGGAVLMHPVTVLVIVAHALIVWGRPMSVRWCLIAITASLPGIGLLAVTSVYQSKQLSWIKVLSLDVLPEKPLDVAGSAAVGAVLLALAVLGVQAGRDSAAVAVWAFGPIGVLLLGGLVSPIWVPRYLVFTLPALALLAAAALVGFRLAAGVCCLAAVALMGLPAQQAIRTSDGHTQDTRAIASIIGPRFHPGDVAVYGDNHPSIPWSPRDLVARYLPADRTPVDVLALAPQRTDGNFMAPECPDVASCMRGARRVWVVRADGPADVRAGLDDGKSAYLEANYKISGVWRRLNLTVGLLIHR